MEYQIKRVESDLHSPEPTRDEQQPSPTRPATPCDEELVRRIVAGDIELFDELITRHRDRVYRIVARQVPAAEIDEIAHDAFVAVFLALPRYSPSHPFAHWLTRIALRRCCDYWRERYRHNERRGDIAELESIRARRGDGGAALEDRELLEWALARLPINDRLVITVLHLEELTVRECAAVLELSESNVKVRAHRARARLEQILGSHRNEHRDGGPDSSPGDKPGGPPTGGAIDEG